MWGFRVTNEPIPRLEGTIRLRGMDTPLRGTLGTRWEVFVRRDTVAP
jgi:hypothetical protein